MERGILAAAFVAMIAAIIGIAHGSGQVGYSRGYDAGLKAAPWYLKFDSTSNNVEVVGCNFSERGLSASGGGDKGYCTVKVGPADKKSQQAWAKFNEWRVGGYK